MRRRVYEADCVCGLRWLVYRDDDDDGHSSTCVECGTVVYRLSTFEWSRWVRARQCEMRRDGTVECNICGATLDVPAGQVPRVTLVVDAAGKPSMRVVTLGNKEIHRCAIPTRQQWMQRHKSK